MSTNNGNPKGSGPSDKARLHETARKAMTQRGLEPDFPPNAVAELNRINGNGTSADPAVRDFRSLLWCSIDNDDSRDLDQLTVAESVPGGGLKAFVAVADVDSLVHKGSPLDAHASRNTTSVYTAGGVFPMLPEKLSTDLTSLNFETDRLAVVAQMEFDGDAALQRTTHFRALVRNKAKLAYDSVAAWLDGSVPAPEPVRAVGGLADNLKLQDGLAQKLRTQRQQRGALDLETIQAHAVYDGSTLLDMVAETKNRAKNIIEDFMIAANGATARFMVSQRRSMLRRVVRTPKHWDRIVELAREKSSNLPREPDSRALARFLDAARKAHPETFPDLSLSVIKLLGPGEYVLDCVDCDVPGHFALAVRDYSHSTAPNRRYPDLVTQRLLKAALAGQPPPYSNSELDLLAKHCTEAEDAAKHVEREVAKCGAALLLRRKIGQVFDGMVTGVTGHGTWVRLSHPPIEGKVLRGFEGLEVGNPVRVRLVGVNLDRCFIDFERAAV